MLMFGFAFILNAASVHLFANVAVLRANMAKEIRNNDLRIMEILLNLL